MGFSAGTVLLFKKRISFIIMAVLFLIGGFYGNYENSKYSPLEKYASETCSGRMYVTDIDSFDDEYNFIRVKAVVTDVNNENVKEPILLTIYGISHIDVNTVIHFEKMKFEFPPEARNDGGFNYNKYLKSKGIRFTASEDVKNLRASGTDGFLPLKLFRTLKQKFTQRCKRVLGDNDAAGIIPAILVGSDVLLSKDIRDLFSEAGITHILVASGMHVVVILSLFSIVFFPLRKKRWLYELLLGLSVICFAMIVGYTPSMARSVIALFIYFAAKKMLRSADSVTVLFEAMAVILIINPLSIYDLSFQLSFSAVFGIIIFTQHLAERFYWLVNLPKLILNIPSKAAEPVSRAVMGGINAAAVSASAQMGVLPFVMGAFGGMGILALFTNVMISLIVPFVYGFGICAVALNIEPFVTGTKWLCDILIRMAEITTKVPGNYVQLPESDIVTLAIICFVAVCLLRCKVEKFKPFFEPAIYICTAVVAVSCMVISYVPKNEAEVTFLNVDNGDCAIIRLADNKTVVVDTGTESMCDFEVIPYLKRRNIDKIDYLFLSHNDSDHMGGTGLLAEELKVEQVITGGANNCNIENAEHRIVQKGDKINIGKACFEILYAPVEAKNDNDSSVVMRMDFGESSFLFTGDMSKKVEQLIEKVDADVLKVSHHGAKSASTEEFLKRVSPKFSVISVEKNNRYGQPDAETLKRLCAQSYMVFRTDRDKTITITANLNGTLELTKRLKRTIINDRK